MSTDEAYLELVSLTNTMCIDTNGGVPLRAIIKICLHASWLHGTYVECDTHTLHNCDVPYCGWSRFGNREHTSRETRES